MSYETCSASPLEAVQVELRPGGAASDVWLRRSIEKDVRENGPDAEDATEFFRAEEIHFVQAGAPTEEELQVAFGDLREAHESDELTDIERIDALMRQLDTVNAALDDTVSALMELDDIVGGVGNSGEVLLSCREGGQANLGRGAEALARIGTEDD